MNNRLLFSTGMFFHISESFSEAIRSAAQFDVDGLELCYLHFSELDEFVVEESAKKVLEGFSFNTLHAPGDIEHPYQDSEFCARILERVKRIASRFGCRNVTMHADQVSDLRFVHDVLASGFYVCIENVNTPGAPLDGQPSDASYITLDVAHAIDDGNLQELVDTFGDRIRELHWSLPHSGRGHNFVHTCQDTDTLRALEPLRKLDCPVVLEVGIKRAEDAALIPREMRFVREFFKS